MEKFTLVIGNKNYSSWSLRPWLVLKQCEILFKEILVPLYQGDFKKEILKHSPAGKVPILKHGKTLVWESLSISEYLADLFPRKKLWPSDRAERAWARSISNEMHGGFQNLRSNCPMNVRADFSEKPRDSATQKDIERIVNIWTECRKRFKKKGKFLFGHFTIADAMYMPVVFRFNTYGVTLSGAADEYFQTMLELPAVKEWIASAVKEPWVIGE